MSTPREQLPTALVSKIADAFGPVLPDGVYLSVRGKTVGARGPHGGVSSGTGGINLLQLATSHWLSDEERFRRRVEATARGVANAISWVINLPIDRHEARDIHRLIWPVLDAKVKVKLRGRDIDISFVDPAGRTALALPAIHWDGPRSEIRKRTAESSHQYVGPVDQDQIERDREADEERQRRAAAYQAVMRRLADRNLGEDKTAIRAAIREEFAGEPEASPPKPDSYLEDRLVDLVALRGATHPRAGSVKFLGRAAFDGVKWLNAHRSRD